MGEGNWTQGTGGRRLEEENWGTGRRELELGEGNWRQGTGGRRLEEGTGGKGTGGRELAEDDWRKGNLEELGGRDLGL